MPCSNLNLTVEIVCGGHLVHVKDRTYNPLYVDTAVFKLVILEIYGPLEID